MDELYILIFKRGVVVAHGKGLFALTFKYNESVKYKANHSRSIMTEYINCRSIVIIRCVVIIIKIITIIITILIKILIIIRKSNRRVYVKLTVVNDHNSTYHIQLIR